MSFVRAFALLAFAAAILCGTSGCASSLAGIVVQSPNGGRPNAARNLADPTYRAQHEVDRFYLLDVGPPHAELGILQKEPSPAFREPRGTILVLHGMGGESLWMMHFAKAFSEDGYRVFLVDSRGHGASTGEHVTYGVHESQDLRQILDALDAAHLISGRVGVFGYSLGASSAILHAAKDPRVEAVVAVAPFRSLEHEAPDYIRGALPGVGALFPETMVDAYVKQGAEQAGFEPELADPESVVAAVKARILLLHGEDDTLIPIEHSVAIHRASPERTRLIRLPDRGHLSIWMDRDGEVARCARVWFDRHLPEAPAFSTVPLPGDEAMVGPIASPAPALPGPAFGGPVATPAALR